MEAYAVSAHDSVTRPIRVVITHHARARLWERVVTVLRAQPGWRPQDSEEDQLRAWVDETVRSCRARPTDTGAWEITRRASPHIQVLLTVSVTADTVVIITARTQMAPVGAEAQRIARHKDRRGKPRT